jgi:C4-type Zn-finger protein
MTLHTEATARTRLVTYDKNNCPQCQAWLLAPTWSEYFNERCVRHTWTCDACGYEFETAVLFAVPKAVAA